VKFLAASVYCACVALVALGLTLLAIAHATSIVSASALFFAGAFCVVSTVILSRALTGRGETQRPALDLVLRGLPRWLALSLAALAVASVAFSVPWTIVLVAAAAVHISGARVWGAPRVCLNYHPAGAEPRFCPTCGARTQDPFLPEARIRRAHRDAALQKMFHSKS
jgi:hypothetical protein